jgi:hypothetical protein
MVGVYRNRLARPTLHGFASIAAEPQNAAQRHRKPKMNKLLLALLLTPTLALAQTSDSASRIKTPAPAAEPTAALVTFTPFTALAPETAPAPHACVQPPVAKAFSSQKEADAFNAALQNYQACVKNYVEVNTAAANKHAEAANAAVAEANAYIVEINTKFASGTKK